MHKTADFHSNLLVSWDMLTEGYQGRPVKCVHFKWSVCISKDACRGNSLVQFLLALEIAPNDPKALFRRCQAYEQLEEYENAYKDAARLIQIDPRNTAIQPVLRRLNPIIQQKVSGAIQPVLGRLNPITAEDKYKYTTCTAQT